MNAVRTIFAIFRIEKSNLLKNKKTVLIMFTFPIVSLLISLLESEEYMIALLPVFVCAHVVLVPIMCVATLVAEEKEKGILRLLAMSDVLTIQYLIGIGLIVHILSTLGIFMFDFVVSLDPEIEMEFILLSIEASIISLLIGALLGLTTKSQANVGTKVLPVIISIFILPSLGKSSEVVHSVSRFLYSDILMEAITIGEYDVRVYITLLIHILVIFFVLIGYCYKSNT